MANSFVLIFSCEVVHFLMPAYNDGKEVIKSKMTYTKDKLDICGFIAYYSKYWVINSSLQ
jgi:hypothetical protein